MTVCHILVNPPLQEQVDRFQFACARRSVDSCLLEAILAMDRCAGLDENL